MLSSCAVCLDLQPCLSGNAPERSKSVSPTMYDHLKVFREFCKLKENKNKIQEAKRDLLRFDKKFTNFQLDMKNLDETLRDYSTQDIFRFQRRLSIDIENIGNLLRSGLEKTSKSLTNIPRCPIKCPVKSCNQVIGITSILAHFLRDHKQQFPADLNVLGRNQRSILEFHPAVFNKEDIVCLGILAYGENKSEECPVVPNICLKNSFLIEHSHLTDHLPIIIFGCKISICSMINNGNLAHKLSKCHKRMEDLYVIWLSTVETTKRIFCTLTAFDQEGLVSCSTIHEVRKMTSSQNPAEFLSNSSNYLLLSQGDINNLLSNGKQRIELEIFIHMYENDS